MTNPTNLKEPSPTWDQRLFREIPPRSHPIQSILETTQDVETNTGVTAQTKTPKTHMKHRPDDQITDIQHAHDWPKPETTHPERGTSPLAHSIYSGRPNMTIP